MPRVLQGLDGHVQADPVSELEDVGEGLGHRVHAHRLVLEHVRLNAVRKGLTAEAHDTHRWECNGRGAPTLFDRNPDLGRKLGANAVKTQRGEEADDAARRRCGHTHEAMVFRDRCISPAVLASGGSLKRTGGDKPRQVLAVKSGASRATRGDAQHENQDCYRKKLVEFPSDSGDMWQRKPLIQRC